MQTQANNIIGLDVGDKRVGVAMTNMIAKLPRPYKTLTRGDDFWTDLQDIVKEEGITEVVVGLPRNLNGDDTVQTDATRKFVVELKQRMTVKVYTQDEALTSRKAEQELISRGKGYNKGDIDALAATYILEDYLNTPRAANL